MQGINKIILLGTLGKDPEMRQTAGGMAVTSFSIATSETWTDKQSGEKKESTEWHRVVAWRRLGEICGEYLFKGSQVYVEGKLQTRSWEQEGVTRYATDIQATTVQFLGGGARKDQKMDDRRAPDGAPEPPIEDDDIPF